MLTLLFFRGGSESTAIIVIPKPPKIIKPVVVNSLISRY